MEPGGENEAETASASPLPSPDGRRVVTMIENDGREPPASLTERQAEATWAAVSAPWHPAILAKMEGLPTVEGVDFPPVPEPGEIRVVCETAGARLPVDYRQIAADADAFVLELGIDRVENARRILALLDPAADLGDANDPLCLDFFALGTLRWYLRDLTIAMGHADCLDGEGLTRETLEGARAWASGDRTAASNRLRAAFEILTQARERYYPVDCYIVDIVLLDPSLPAGAMADPLAARAPFSFLATGRAIDVAAERDPERMSLLRQAIEEGWADVVGGTYEETDESLRPISSILWQFRRGSESYRQHLDDRNVETLATRRFALYPLRPQIAKRSGFRFAVHLGLDAGRFPVPLESKRLWDSPDATHLESLTRPPVGADRWAEGIRLPWRIGRSMKDDHVATLPLVHWPSPISGWFRDLRRSASYSPVLARWVTLGDYFHLSDRPWEIFGPRLDEYVTPYLAQSVARGSTRPISGRVNHARLRTRFDEAVAIEALARALTTQPTPSDAETHEIAPAEPGPMRGIEDRLETGQIEGVEATIEAHERGFARKLADVIAGTETGGRPGYLVLNPHGIARRAVVNLPDADIDIRPEGPLRGTQFTETGVQAVVDLPAFGFAWVPRHPDLGRPQAESGRVSATERGLANESIAVDFDEKTGGLLSVRARGEEVARLGQQLVISGLLDREGRPATSRMVADAIEIDYGGPSLAQITSRGKLLHPADEKPLARFTQTVELWTGRPTLKLRISLTDLDPEWITAVAASDPWTSNLSCRWAWPDPSASLRRTSLLTTEATESDRPETPDALDISTRRQRTCLLFGGLAHHRRIGKRMLDTLLIAGREEERNFTLGVALDGEYPFQAATDFLSSASVVATDAGIPRVGPVGWLIQIDHKAITIPKVEFLDRTGDGRGWGLALILVETSGRAARCRLRLFRDPVSARQTDFQGDLIMDLPTDGDSVPIDLTPNEMARIEVTLG